MPYRGCWLLAVAATISSSAAGSGRLRRWPKGRRGDHIASMTLRRVSEALRFEECRNIGIGVTNTCRLARGETMASTLFFKFKMAAKNEIITVVASSI